MLSLKNSPRLGVLALGQTPRPDLAQAVSEVLPEAEVLVRGGLDGLTEAKVGTFKKDNAAYPLFVLLADGTTFEAEMRDLIPSLTEQAKNLAAEGAQQVLLMCSGGFPAFDAGVPVIRPVVLLQAIAAAVAPRKRVGIINPIASQQAPAAEYWSKHGFSVTSAFASPFEPDAVCAAADGLCGTGVEALVLDCMSFNNDILSLVKANVSLPVLSPVRQVQTFLAALFG